MKLIKSENILKSLEIGLFLLICILISFSIVVIILIHLELFKLEFTSSLIGLDFYLNSYSQFKVLFTGTVATVAAFLGLQRVKVSEVANKEKIKQDYFNEWKNAILVRSHEIEKYDPIMIQEINLLRKRIYDTLYDFNLKIEDIKQLTNFFNKHFENRINFFEQQNENSRKYGGFYRNDTHSYSFDSFRFVLWRMIDEGYPDLDRDLKTLYLNSLDENRIIDYDLYVGSVAEASNRIRAKK